MMQRQIIVFDKDDTLTKAKCNITNSMAELLSKLTHKYKVAIITGGSWDNIYEQIVSKLPKNTNFKNLYVFPTI
jgi:hydroxymethylpyrimidine pyrophosphatase-like HAD family hydrolase